jgi:hypothetical protein
MVFRREDFVMRGGFELVKEGLGASTLRDAGQPRGWRGLTFADRTLLEAWVDLNRVEVLELHTDVPVGCIPEVDVAEVGRFQKEQICCAHPLRIDACVLRSDGWLVIEVKADAGYKAMGQVLCYGFWASRCIRALAEPRLLVVTDRVQEAIRPVYASFGVEVAEVGESCWDEEEGRGPGVAGP